MSNISNFKNQTISGVQEGFDALLLLDILKQSQNDVLYILSDGHKLAQAQENIRFFAPEVKVLSLPAWDTVPYDRVSPNVEIVAERLKTLSELALNPSPKIKRIILTTVSAVLQFLPPEKIFLKTNLELNIGKTIERGAFLHYLAHNAYTRTEQVMEAGEFAVRGDIIDVFPVGAQNPLRIDLFGDEIEKIRTFDAFSQRTIGEVAKYTFGVSSEIVLDEKAIKTFRAKYRETFGLQDDEIYACISEGRKYMGQENWLPFFYEENLVSIFDYIPRAQIVVGKNVLDAIKSKENSIIDYYQARLEGIKQSSKIEIDIYRPVPPEWFYFNEKQILERFNHYEATYFSALNAENSQDVLPARNFASNKAQTYSELAKYLNENQKLKRIICCNSLGSREKMLAILTEHNFMNLGFAENYVEALQNNKISLVVFEIEKGFRSSSLCLISEADIWGEKQNRKPPKKATSKDFIADISSLNVGELVVHIEHGVGRFLGLEVVVAGGAPHDCLKILYNNEAKLFVPVENVDVLSRYGIEDDNMALDTIGGVAWGAKKAKIKQKIKEIAGELIKIAALRELKKADSFIASAGGYDEFCAGFVYNETDDQLNAINDVIADLAKGMPMDRLVCGDVGFGKTEVALRAAFCVASNGAQVAVIVPTTLLARQHYHNFKKRFEGFPIKVKMLSRLVGAKEAKETKEGLKNGNIEIVIGTHALLAKDMEFCNLGLLIVDEEQHFGVSHKEKLKNLKANVHVLTLTATPIPRTLQLSLTGVKQLSVITTPPVDRLAVRSFVMPFDKVMIKEAIYREKYRNGQIFFVCPRVSDIFGVQKELEELVPDIKMLVAHGQMPVSRLEDVMNEFADGNADLLLSTTIIESGIDMPSVNTMIIHRADMFGLAQLYQLKGRIGRSKLRGYCYFTVPPKRALKPIAERRLNILQALDSLGAGFSLASHDMDIRGSGNILGDEQSGHIKEVGIALYHHMLEEEIMRLKAGGNINDEVFEWSPQIATGIPIMISEAYVPDLGVRLGLYKRIGDLKTKTEIEDMKVELVDRFGKIPDEVNNLLKTVEIKQLCIATNIDKIDAGAKGVLIAFRNGVFAEPMKLLDFVAKSFGKIKIRHDQKLFIEANLENYATRVATILEYVIKINQLL